MLLKVKEQFFDILFRLEIRPSSSVYGHLVFISYCFGDSVTAINALTSTAIVWHGVYRQDFRRFRFGVICAA